MKINPNYLGRLFTEQELSPEEQQLAKKLPSMRKEKGKLFCQRCDSKMCIRDRFYMDDSFPIYF